MPRTCAKSGRSKGRAWSSWLTWDNSNCRDNSNEALNKNNLNPSGDGGSSSLSTLGSREAQQSSRTGCERTEGAFTPVTPHWSLHEHCTTQAGRAPRKAIYIQFYHLFLLSPFMLTQWSPTKFIYFDLTMKNTSCQSTSCAGIYWCSGAVCNLVF